MPTTLRSASSSAVTAVPHPERASALLAMTRPSQVALIMVILANGILLGVWRTGAAPGAAALAWAFLLTALTAAAVHLANEAADHRTDRLTRRTRFSGGSGALLASDLSPRVPLRLAQALAVVVAVAAPAGVAGGVLTAPAGVLLLAGLGGGLAYSLRPVAAMRRGWGEPLNALLGSMLLPLLGVAVVSGTIAADDIIAFLPFFFATLASVMATAWPDRDADAVAGKATMQVRLAPGLLRRIHAASAAGFVIATVVSAVLGAMPLALAGLLVLPALAVGALRYTRTTAPAANVVAMVGLALLTTTTLCLALAVTPT